MKIGFIGSGWRTRTYWRIIRMLPERFEISGVYFRDAEKAAAYEAEGQPFGGKAYTDLDEFLAAGHDMVMILIPRKAVLPYIEKVTAAGLPVLVETPPANGVEELKAVWALQKRYGAKIQVAEQYFLQPYHRAVQSLVDLGVIGDVSNLRISMMHDYHGISVLRHLLGAGLKPCTIYARGYEFPVLYHIGRNNLELAENQRMIRDRRKVASFEYDDGKVGFFDFADEQYFNYFRSRHLNVQGTHGEINDYDVAWMSEDSIPMTARMVRQEAGPDSNLEGMSLHRITWNGKVLCESPFLGRRTGSHFVNAQEDARLSDDEIGMASLLAGMERMIAGGEEIYPLAEALQDTYLYLMMDEAIRTGKPVRTEQMPWME